MVDTVVAPSAPLRRFGRAVLLAGLLSGAPSTLHALLTGGDVLAATRAAGTFLPGRRRRPALVAGAIAHGAVTLWWVGVLALVDHRRPLGPWRGALAGAGIAALDLGVVAPRRAPAIAALPQLPQWADHVAFGALAGASLRRSASARRPGPRCPPCLDGWWRSPQRSSRWRPAARRATVTTSGGAR